MKRNVPGGGPTAAFLMAQVGAHGAMRFAERLEPLGLGPPHAGILRVLRQSAGLSQQMLGRILSIQPSRLVALLDELEKRGLVERRHHPDDRRLYALYLTKEGQRAVETIGELARAHDDALCGALDATERATLTALLQRIATDQGLTPGVHPGFRRMGPPRDGEIEDRDARVEEAAGPKKRRRVR